MKHVSLLIKPASGLCNMRCKYCFYYDVVDHRASGQHGMMSEETLEALVKRAYEQPRESVSFMFQGGEPTLVGLSFFERFIQFVKRYNQHSSPTTFSIQTNGTNIDQHFARFLKINNFLVGISIDGNQRLHDKNRLHHNLQGSFKAVQKGLRHLQQQQVDYNILTVITDDTVEHTESVYRYLSNLGTDYLQFIPCIDSFNEDKGGQTLSTDSYLEFLKRLFDVWYRDFQNGKRISIRYFDDVLKMMLGYHPSTCTQFGYCALHQVVEADGTVYPCDFYVVDEWLLGNIHETSLDELSTSEKAKEFIRSSYGVHNDCRSCRYYSICRGGCRRNKEPFSQVDKVKTKFCQAYYQFFDYSVPRFVKMVDTLKKEQKLE